MFEATCIDREIIDSHVVIGNIESPTTDVVSSTVISYTMTVPINGYASIWVDLSGRFKIFRQGLINGMTTTTIDPQGATTRAQTAAMFERFLTAHEA